MKVLSPISINNLCSKKLKAYFKNSFMLYDSLFQSIQEENGFYNQPNIYRKPLIFYLGHTAAFYINKLKLAGLLKNGVNDEYEKIFAIGVDPKNENEWLITGRWPEIDKVWEYRKQVEGIVSHLIDNNKLPSIVGPEDPYWSLLMGIEHERIHFETSSVLLHECPIEILKQPFNWTLAPLNGGKLSEKFLFIPGGKITLEKRNFSVFGWDNEYGCLTKDVSSFYVGQNLITNEEFLEFVLSGGYVNQNYWSKDGWKWKCKSGIKYPRFWQEKDKKFLYRSIFNIIDLPLQWPVEINFFEAEAYCQWKGEGARLMQEEEYQRISDYFQILIQKLFHRDNINVNLKYFSPSPVGLFSDNDEGIHDLYGNVWEWVCTAFHPLSGFKPHPYYLEYSKPYFDREHAMMLGGSFASTGVSALPDYRSWFRKNFYQHAGFRIVKSIKQKN